MPVDAPNVISMTTLGYLDNGGTFLERALHLPKSSRHLPFTFRLQVQTSSLQAHCNLLEVHCKLTTNSHKDHYICIRIDVSYFYPFGALCRSALCTIVYHCDAGLLPSTFFDCGWVSLAFFKLSSQGGLR